MHRPSQTQNSQTKPPFVPPSSVRTLPWRSFPSSIHTLLHQTGVIVLSAPLYLLTPSSAAQTALPPSPASLPLPSSRRSRHRSGCPSIPLSVPPSLSPAAGRGRHATVPSVKVTGLPPSPPPPPPPPPPPSARPPSARPVRSGPMLASSPTHSAGPGGKVGRRRGRYAGVTVHLPPPPRSLTVPPHAAGLTGSTGRTRAAGDRTSPRRTD